MFEALGLWAVINVGLLSSSQNKLGFRLSNNFKILKTSSSSFSKKLQTTNKIHQITNK
jgi:hypothetical protein